MVDFDPRPVTLEGRVVRLEPLSLEHATHLHEPAAQDASTWDYMPVPPPASPHDTEQWVRHALAERDAGREVPFAIVERSACRAIGSTRYLDLRRTDRALEIGWTWIAPAWRRTAVNTECKLLLLRHAFDDLGAWRVQFKTDARNVASQRAIARLGAVREGVLRRHRRCWDGFVRDTVYYSILDREWQDVRRHLERHAAPDSPGNQHPGPNV